MNDHEIENINKNLREIKNILLTQKDSLSELVYNIKLLNESNKLILDSVSESKLEKIFRKNSLDTITEFEKFDIKLSNQIKEKILSTENNLKKITLDIISNSNDFFDKTSKTLAEILKKIDNK